VSLAIVIPYASKRGGGAPRNPRSALRLAEVTVVCDRLSFDKFATGLAKHHPPIK
jgi:hypothetical protein